MKFSSFLFCFALGVACATAAPRVLVPGCREGKAFDATQARLTVSGRSEYATPPLTVECWAKLHSKDNFNILIAQEPKASPTHWEIYSYAGSGVFSAYLPGCQPAEIKSRHTIADGSWHFLVMLFEPARVRLYVDGQVVADEPIQRSSVMQSGGGDLAIGAIIGDRSLRCDGLIGEVRISQGVRSTQLAPLKPLAEDEQTIGLWRMDKVSSAQIPDHSAFRNPARLQFDQPVQPIALDELDRQSFKAGPSPGSSKAHRIKLEASTDSVSPSSPANVSLDGDWEMAQGGDQEQRLKSDWPDAIAAKVPGSVHSALFVAGKIPDPKFGRNDAIAHQTSFETWWLRRRFSCPREFIPERLIFDGVAIRCTVWLNGQCLGSHDGMFSGPVFDVGRTGVPPVQEPPLDKSSLIQSNNTLVVKLEPAPGDRNAWNNPDWRKTVVFNCVWGWHYSSIPPLGIWRPVRLEGKQAVRIEHPFIIVRDAEKGIVDLIATLHGPEPGWSGKLTGVVYPDNFIGKPYRFTHQIKTTSASNQVHLQFQIPNPQLWWPNDLGAPNLYRLRLSFATDAGLAPVQPDFTFGLRTVEMAPLPGGPRSTNYNWTFVINKRPTFVKGSGWCTMDSSMDFSPARYQRLISLARQQHVQMLRCWGSGMPETDEFYDACDRNGIMVLQEWPTAWDSHLVQPYEVLEETVRLNTLRLRNRPSLVMYGGGNESGHPFGNAIDLMGRYAIELDGTRPFHRGEPWGGSAHNYDCYWGRQPLDHNLNMTAAFWGEFGLACMPVYESVLRYLPEAERNIWPPLPDGSLIHHTPIFGTAEDWSRLSQYSGYFTEPTDLESFIVGSQLSQAVGVRHTLERARTRWPHCTGALYYKMNDNYPAASWSCVDWYGAPKLGHYFFQDAFAPLHACVLFNSISNQGKPVSWPVFLLDDAQALHRSKWEVQVRALDQKLRVIKSQNFTGRGPIRAPKHLGALVLTADQTQTSPLFVVSEIKTNGALADRTFYFVNYEASRGSLFKAPRTQVTLSTSQGRATVKNTGSVPAVALALLRPGYLDTFSAEDNYFWLEPGESKTISVSDTDGLKLEGWNLDGNP